MEKTSLKDFLSALKDVLKQWEDVDDFRNKYNNYFKQERTRLMLGDGDNRTKSVIYKSLINFYKISAEAEGLIFHKKKPIIGFERYADCMIYRYGNGDMPRNDNKENWSKRDTWYEGKVYNDFVIEVENKLGEFIGTFSDLLRIQSCKKIAIFFDKNKDRFLEKKENELRKCWSYFFNEKGFLEAESTEYLIIFLPDEYEDEEGFLSSICGIYFKGGFENVSFLPDK